MPTGQTMSPATYPSAAPTSLQPGVAFATYGHNVGVKQLYRDQPFYETWDDFPFIEELVGTRTLVGESKGRYTNLEGMPIVSVTDPELKVVWNCRWTSTRM